MSRFGKEAGGTARCVRDRPVSAERRQYVRAFGACVIVSVLVAAVPISGAVEDAGGEGVVQETAVLVGQDALSVIQDGGESEAGQQADAPAGFEDEVISLSGRNEVRVGAEGAVVGFSAVADAPTAFSSVAAELLARGWTQVASGSDTCASFVKQEGRYRWVFVSCTQVAGAASVVITHDAQGKEA